MTLLLEELDLDRRDLLRKSGKVLGGIALGGPIAQEVGGRFVCSPAPGVQHLSLRTVSSTKVVHHSACVNRAPRGELLELSIGMKATWQSFMARMV